MNFHDNIKLCSIFCNQHPKVKLQFKVERHFISLFLCSSYNFIACVLKSLTIQAVKIKSHAVTSCSFFYCIDLHHVARNARN